MLSVTDTISITTDTFSVIATDGHLETVAINSGISLSIDGRSFAPSALHLDQNYPNPFNSTTVIGFDLPKSDDVSLIIYDLLGEEIAVLVNKEQKPGNYSVQFDASEISSGIYYYKLLTNNYSQTKKMIVLK